MRKNASRPDTENPAWSEKEIRDARPLMDMLPPGTARRHYERARKEKL